MKPSKKRLPNEPTRVYRYFDVPYSVFDELMSAESKGAYFNEHVRDMYAYEEDEPA